MTPQRAYLEQVLLPRFAEGFKINDKVVNIGAGYHPYKEYFKCNYRTSDKDDRSSQERYPVEQIPYQDNTLDGIVFIGVFERMDDPMQGMRELKRVLKKGGKMLFGAPYKFEWSSPADYWRLTPAGLSKIFADCTILETQNIDDVYLFAVIQK